MIDGSISVEWDKNDIASGAYLSHECQTDFLGSVILTSGSLVSKIEPVPVLTFVKNLSWCIASALFTGEKITLEILEYPEIFKLEVTKLSEVIIYDLKGTLRFNLHNLCKQIGELELSLLLDIIKKPEDLAFNKVILHEHFLGPKAYNLRCVNR